MKRSVKPARTIRFAGFLFCELFALLVSVASLHAGILVFDSFPAVLATEGSPFSGVLGTFTDSVADPTSSLTGTINWGDGTNSAGTIALSAGVYSLSGTMCTPKRVRTRRSSVSLTLPSIRGIGAEPLV